MLDGNHSKANITAWIDTLPCLVRQSESVVNMLGKSGLVPTLPGCNRSRPRRYCQAHEVRIALGYRQSLPDLKRDVAWYGVQAVNISHTGIGFIHSALLYPSERLVLVTRDGVCRNIEIAWCRRIEDQCYLAGATLSGTIASN